MEAIEKQEIFEFLDWVRESGTTNMFGAGPLIQQGYGVSRYEARELLSEWMRTFGERHVA